MSKPAPKRILLLNGHPDPAEEHLCAALAGAYRRGAELAGHQVDRIDVGALDFPMIRSLKDFQGPAFTADIKAAQDRIQAADHLVIVFPIWFGSPPAVLKGFFEQLLRKGFALSSPQSALVSLLAGKSVRLIVTMGAPVLVFNVVAGGHGVGSVKRGLLWAAGAGPVRVTLLGRAHLDQPAVKARWQARVERLGHQGR